MSNVRFHAMQRHYIAAALILLTALASAQSITQRAENDETTNMRSEEPAMQRAMEKARATLDDFLIKAKQPPAGTSSYALKVGIREGRDTEYFWVNEFTWSDGSFTGRINNEPRLVKNIKPGQIYKFSRSQIVDWTYVDEKNGRTFGNFTACALLSKEPPAQAEEFKRRYGLDCS
jgi:uncharacterized protein YegJ (DUF2314 family)